MYTSTKQWGLSTPKDNGWCSSVAFPISYKNNNYIIIGCGYVNTDDNYFTRGDIFAPNIIQDTRTLNSCLFRSYLQNGQPVVAVGKKAFKLLLVHPIAEFPFPTSLATNPKINLVKGIG